MINFVEMKNRIALCSALVLMSLAAGAQNKVTSDYDAYLNEREQALHNYKKRSEEGQQKIAEDWARYQLVSENDYQKYLAAETARYEEFRRRVIACWGEENYAEDGPKRLVEYSEDYQSRSDVDFENGTVEIEVLAKVDEKPEVVEDKLKAAVKDLMELRIDEEQAPVLEGQMEQRKYNLDEEAVSADLADKIVAEEDKSSKVVKTDEGEMQIVTVKVKLAENHISTRAAKFKDIIHRNSVRFSIDEPLLYAVIEQESAFNPRAKSPVPAYGLMQLVPKSGGREAFRHVHKKDIIPLPAYLYVPENNVELGTGYLHRLMTVVFAGVKDPDCRMLCAVAAYNTGPGNVSRAMTGGTAVSKAVSVINMMTYDRLYEHLRTQLPYAETRDYIQKVTSKRRKYMDTQAK